MLFFRFDSWHTSPLDNRKYAIDIISKLNRRVSRESLIEIGCGLGDILRKTHYDRKYFYDISPEVLGAAAFLQKFSKITSINSFKTFNLLTDTVEKDLKFDALVLVNWIHGFESKTLKYRLNKIVNNNLNEKGLIVFDIIENNPIYKFNHAVVDLIDVRKFDVTTFSEYPFGRKLVFAELK
jgi:SAM-dependent methyltransferase